MQWDDPKAIREGLPGPQTDLDIYVYDAVTGVLVAYSEDYNEFHGFEFLTIPRAGTFDIYVDLFSGVDPNIVKLVFTDEVSGPEDGIISAGTVVGHMNARGAIGVAAAPYSTTPGFGVSPAQPESFTSAGGVPILFDTLGNRLFKEEIRQSPAITGPDRTCNSFFGKWDGGKCYRFSGTSAAAPNVAAVAALMLQRQPRLQPADIRAILQRTAEDMDAPETPWFDRGYDQRTGTGFVNALYAVAEAGMPLSKVKAGKGKSKKGGKGEKSGKSGGKGNNRNLKEVYEDTKKRRHLEREEQSKPASQHYHEVNPRHSLERRRRMKKEEKEELTTTRQAKNLKNIRGA